MNELTVFNSPEFGQVRTIEEDGKVLFCGSDVAKALGYKNPTKAIADHCKGTIERRTNDSLGRQQNMKFIPEGDIYRLAAKSELPGADKFESWIFDEVIPSIRKTGSYTAKEHPMTSYQKMMAEKWERDHALQEARFYAGMARRYKGTTYEQVLNAYATKSLSGEYLVPLPQMGERLLTAGEVGEQLGVSANMVGRLAKQYNLKTTQYGEWLHDKSRYSDKQVPCFHYRACVVDKLREILQADK